ncbi:sensor domain-containing phosphodiesterase [Aliarcobacter cibarius]|uniref:EAL domain-containing protein n=1 Tax=Aliarcobacter cibarius TaxID=255507 RepID=A0ABY2V8W0_9BACT|nr:GGDEF domain-containing phosphodiesterase [Aliarcobacter cibarius]TLS97846.1 EAL domain-containing protein [Aliarcobacter cibarius]TLS98607.1 EAL domain-containing protein [Aliarcobacter cibarius]
MTLKIKSFINIIISTSIVFFLSGYITFNYFENILQEQISKEIEHDTKKIKNEIKNIEENQKNIINKIENDEKILSILNLISNYEDKENYEYLVFNFEKESLLEYIQKYSKDGENILIEFFDKNYNLIIKKSFDDKISDSFFVFYEKGIPYTFSKINNKSVNPLNYNNKLCLTKDANYKYENNNYVVCQKKEIVKDNQSLGFVKISYYLNSEELHKFSSDLIYPVSFSLDKSKYEFVTPLIVDIGLYLVHHVDKNYFNDKENEFILNMFISIIVLIVLFFTLSSVFITKNIIEPLFKLKIALESMLNKKYRPIEIINNDEIGKIFEASNKIFKEFWKSYSDLESYTKSVEISNLVMKMDINGNITYANELFCKTSEYSRNEIIGKTHEIFRHPDTLNDTYEKLWDSIKRGDLWRGVLKNQTKNNKIIWTDSVLNPIYDINKKIEGYICISRDITELMNKNDELEYRANYDLLTKEFNRNKLIEDLENTEFPILILININRFSQINDFYGYDFGDIVLHEFSQFLRFNFIQEFKNDFKFYRYGGDEFAILLENLDKDTLIPKIKNILKNLESKIIVLEDKEITLNLSCGISFEQSTRTLLTAGIALRICKKGHEDLVVYSDKNNLEKEYENNILWASKVKKAIEEDRVVPFFQPIVNNKNLKYEKYEVLARIVESDGKVISPFFFLDIAKQTKQYLKITKIVVEKSFEMFKNKDVEFSINLTMEDISNKQMRDFLYDKFDTHTDTTKRLVIELVESESIKDYDLVSEFIDNAKSKGCKIAIDDFGSGYSNFEYLVKLKADYIKIDGSLIKNINSQKESYIVVLTIVNFAKQMGIKTIAEFIENEEIYKTINDLGIDFSQGYYFSSPKKDLF